jgi:hypothetical protein
MKLLYAAFGLVIATQACAQTVDTSMVGRWSGVARIFVNWTNQRELPVTLDIHSDGTVEGTVGDATLAGGRFHANRGWLGRALRFKTDWIVEGKLEGTLVAADSVVRDAVKIPLDFDGETFDGGVNSSGSMFGGKERMWLAAGHLVLRRVTAAAPPPPSRRRASP